MDETNFDWDDVRLFLAVARGGGLATAVRSTGKSAPTLGRRMLKLERQLGQELFRRQARGYTLTDKGEAFLESATALESHLVPMLDTESALPVVKVSAGTWVTHLLCTRITELSDQHSVRLRFISAEETLDIRHREAVIGIRNQRPKGQELAARKIGRVQFAAYAIDAEIATWALVINATPSAKWLRSQSKNDPVVEVTNPRNALDLALTGDARIVLPTFVGCQVRELKQISMPIEELDHDQWLVTHNEDRFIPEVRRVIDNAYRVLKEVCADN